MTGRDCLAGSAGWSGRRCDLGWLGLFCMGSVLFNRLCFLLWIQRVPLGLRWTVSTPVPASEPVSQSAWYEGTEDDGGKTTGIWAMSENHSCRPDRLRAPESRPKFGPPRLHQSPQARHSAQAPTTHPTSQTGPSFHAHSLPRQRSVSPFDTRQALPCPVCCQPLTPVSIQMKIENCSFSGLKIYPGKGQLFVSRDSKVCPWFSSVAYH